VSYANWDSLMELPVVFKQAGCTIDIFCIEDCWALQNQFHDKWIQANKDEQTFLEELLIYVKQNGNDYNWIIAGDDLIIRLLNEAIEDEDLFYKLLPLTKIENRELLGSKAGFSNLCKKYDIETPRFLIYNQAMPIKDISDYMQYPLMMKVDKSEAGSGVFKCNDEKELIAQLNNVESKENLVFQQFIEGYDINMEVLYKNGELIVYSYAKILKILGKFGLSTQRLFYRNEDIEPALVKIGRGMGINGFASIAFMYNELDKKHYLIEVDVRPNSWIYYGKFTGNDFSEGIRKIMKGDLTIVKPTEQKFLKPIKIVHYKKDMARVIVEKDIKGLLAWVFNIGGCWRFIPFYDKKLLSACNKYLRRFTGVLFKNKLIKMYNKIARRKIPLKVFN